MRRRKEKDEQEVYTCRRGKIDKGEERRRKVKDTTMFSDTVSVLGLLTVLGSG